MRMEPVQILWLKLGDSKRMKIRDRQTGNSVITQGLIEMSYDPTDTQ